MAIASFPWRSVTTTGRFTMASTSRIAITRSAYPWWRAPRRGRSAASPIASERGVDQRVRRRRIILDHEYAVSQLLEVHANRHLWYGWAAF
jgi:hypothetical protein